jgi:hypothetical protein
MTYSPVHLEPFKVSLLTPPAEEETIGLVQGKKPDSVHEWRASLAYEALHVKYYFQVELLGGRRERGGMIVDFVVDLPPRMVATPVHGEYWHGQNLSTEDRFEQAIMEDMGFTVVPLYQSDLESVEQAIASIRRKVL